MSRVLVLTETAESHILDVADCLTVWCDLVCSMSPNSEIKLQPNAMASTLGGLTEKLRTALASGEGRLE